MVREREWLHFDVRKSGECEATCNGKPWTGRYEVGIVTSGKSRVYEGVYTKMVDTQGQEWIGQHRWSYIGAMKQQFAAMAASGVHLVCAGLDPKFYTTGLSDGTGYGYLEGREAEGAFHVMDQPDRA